MQYLNLGCGNRYHPDWINIDIFPSGPGVIAHDLSQGIPLLNDSCEVVYHSNLLEHIRCIDALPFMQECCRVLKPGGILRVAVPDLERICRLYLEMLETALDGDTNSACNYDWMMLEMYDQVVREQSGGGMVEYLRHGTCNESFVYERIGEEGRNLVHILKQEAKTTTKQRWLSRLSNPAGFLRSISSKFRDSFLYVCVGPKGLNAYRIGRFRLGGEVHQWMYDRYSLARLMIAAGFQDPVLQSPRQSLIPNWSDFNLDTMADGTVNKPDSMFLEAIKPAGIKG